MTGTININAAFDAVTEHWSPKVIARVNDQYVKIAKVKGQIAWHKHDEEDELFQVVYGSLHIEFEDGNGVILNPGELCVVPKGVLHNPVAREECGIILIESITTKHTGDVSTPYTKTIEKQLRPLA
jgi:mannose-6-phosphate isomerase-like protein (cupin superfamily)